MRGKQFGKALACVLLFAAVLLTVKAPVVFAAGNGQIGGGTTGSQQNNTDRQAAKASEPTPDKIAGRVLASDPSSAALPITAQPKEPAADYTKIFQYHSDVLFSGIYKSNGFFFDVKKYWKSVYAYARVEFSVSPLIQNVPASLTFFVNSTPVSACKVDYGSGKTQQAYVEIPVSLLKTGYNQFTISGYVRVYDDDGCLDDFSGSNWVNVSKNSLVQVGYDVAVPKQELSYYPYPFLSSVDETGKECAVYVPNDASEEELATALLLRADLAGETGTEDRISLKTLDQYGQDNISRRVVVAARNKLPASLSSGVKEDSGHSLQTHAFVCEISGTDGDVLVVTSDNDQALYEGAAMLMDQNRVSQEKKSYAYVAVGSADTVIQNSKLSDLVADQYTVEEITGGGLSFVGPFRHEQEVYLPLSGGFILSEGGKIVLNFRYSDNLDFKRSLVTVYWGDIPVYSKKLERDKAGGDTLSFLLPSDVVGTYAGSIRIAFDLEIQDLYCTKRADEMPWAYVTGDSSFYLPVGQSSQFSFDTRPYPFQTLGLFENTCVVVPDSMSDTELNTLGEVIAMEGSDVSPYGTLSVVRASNFRQNTDANLVVVGTYRDNKVLASLNDKLSFSYEKDGSRFAGNQQLLLSENYAADIGVLQLLRSPYVSGRAVLVVSGTTDQTLATIGSYLADETKRWNLSGDAFLIDSGYETKSFTFLEGQEGKSPTLRETLRQNKDAVAFTLVSTCAMLLLLLAIILVIVRAKRHREEDKK
ncbi:MAG: cellulose biosynthesis cyclic di-GMP-binding regulatory protein BcsB [Oscillospiraceae bacterium]|jgi:hypothetical protein|nr:cellulose biosynthesis cyclic di-GMP-binding regulatory protein BcsB [Oscillospiraceae bacterium]